MSEMNIERSKEAHIVIDDKVCQDDKDDASPVNNLGHYPHKYFPK
jgi:hypothetical protein